MAYPNPWIRIHKMFRLYLNFIQILELEFTKYLGYTWILYGILPQFLWAPWNMFSLVLFYSFILMLYFGFQRHIFSIESNSQN